MQTLAGAEDGNAHNGGSQYSPEKALEDRWGVFENHTHGNEIQCGNAHIAGQCADGMGSITDLDIRSSR